MPAVSGFTKRRSSGRSQAHSTIRGKPGKGSGNAFGRKEKPSATAASVTKIAPIAAFLITAPTVRIVTISAIWTPVAGRPMWEIAIRSTPRFPHSANRLAIRWIGLSFQSVNPQDGLKMAKL
jgi:hypothetical protein